jgi:hypothetical protein
MTNGAAAVRKAGPMGKINIPKQDGSGKIKIKQFSVEDNASVQFFNQTEGNVTVWIPNGGLLFYPPDGVSSNDIRLGIPANTGHTLNVLSKHEDGDYRYSAFCEAIHDFAEGNSAPIISCP